ncbi:MAG: 16S rRNA processing protein RimM [Gammaproteobacteria bacterium RIFCSPHIGHO2_12_FULL_45_12]|nr:MAG: 16S rRNA processing protein RimM [Gammaproteobacteria bacterium RIFCSPHIGHO2_12_FULL_45_12]
MKHAETTYLTVGKIGAAYGVKGWLKIVSYTEYGASLLDYEPWYLSQAGGNWTSVKIEQGRLYGKGIIAKFPGIDNPEDARLLTGKHIAITRAQLPDLANDEFYWSDLEGLTVINQRGQVLGTVNYLIETGSNDVLVVKGEKERAIPYLKHVILKVDLTQREIHVDWDDL